MKKVIHEKFVTANKNAVDKFEKKLYEETKFLGVLVQNQFEEEFIALKAQFNKELNDQNFAAFEQVTRDFIEHVYNEQHKSKKDKPNSIL